MSDVFGSVYASIYDDLYNDKDYNAECNLIQRIFEQYGSNHIKTILDLGCGTGNHALPLAEQGFEVTGVDCSQEMINKAQSKNTPCTFYLGDIRQFNANRKSDAVLMMFAVLGYQLENADVLAALKTARCHLNPGGLLIFDVWYGPAVLAQRPTDKVKIIFKRNTPQLAAAGIKGMRLGCPAACGVGALPPFHFNNEQKNHTSSFRRFGYSSPDLHCEVPYLAIK